MMSKWQMNAVQLFQPTATVASSLWASRFLRENTMDKSPQFPSADRVLNFALSLLAIRQFCLVILGIVMCSLLSDWVPCCGYLPHFLEYCHRWVEAPLPPGGFVVNSMHFHNITFFWGKSSGKLMEKNIFKAFFVKYSCILMVFCCI